MLTMSLLHSSDLRTSSSAALLTLRLCRCLTADRMCRTWQPLSASTSTEIWREILATAPSSDSVESWQGNMAFQSFKKLSQTEKQILSYISPFLSLLWLCLWQLSADLCHLKSPREISKIKTTFWFHFFFRPDNVCENSVITYVI